MDDLRAFEDLLLPGADLQIVPSEEQIFNPVGTSSDGESGESGSEGSYESSSQSSGSESGSESSYESSSESSRESSCERGSGHSSEHSSASSSEGDDSGWRSRGGSPTTPERLQAALGDPLCVALVAEDALGAPRVGLLGRVKEDEGTGETESDSSDSPAYSLGSPSATAQESATHGFPLAISWVAEHALRYDTA